MNTAARVSPGWSVVSTMSWSLNWNWRQFLIAGLMVSVVMSAFAIVYMKDLNRRLFITYQAQQQQQQQYQVARGKLLLEKSTWARQSRVQRIAENDLGMVMPTSNNVVLVDTKDLPLSSRFEVFSSDNHCQ